MLDARSPVSRAWPALRRRLDALGYDALVRSLRGAAYYEAPWPLAPGAHAIDRSRRDIDVLDLCSGSGILGQIAAAFARRVVAVEREEEALAVSRANAELNGVASRWRVERGDLWGPFADERFDLVLCNPPYIAVPDELGYPDFGHGGADGLALIRRVLAGLPRALRPGGRAQLVFESFGDAEEPRVMALLRDYAEAHPRWALRLQLGSRALLTRAALRPLARTVVWQQREQPSPRRVRDICAQLANAYRRAGWTFNYKALLSVDSAPADGTEGLSVARLYAPWEPASVPRLRDGARAVGQRLVWRAPGSAEVLLDEAEHELLLSLDGQRSLAEAARAPADCLGGLHPKTSCRGFHARAARCCQV